MMRTKIGVRLLIALLALALAPILFLGEVLTNLYKEALIRQVSASLSEIADKKEDEIRVYINEKIDDVVLISHMDQTKNDFSHILEAYQKEGHKGERYVAINNKLTKDYTNYVEIGDYYDLFFISLNGDVFFTVKHEADFTTNIFIGPWRDSELTSVARAAINQLEPDFSQFRHYQPSKAPAAFIATPVVSEGKLLGVLAVQISTDRFKQVVTDDTGLGETGETVAVDRMGNEAVVMMPLKSHPDAAFKLKFDGAKRLPETISHALKGERDQGLTLDYRKKEVLAAWRYIPSARIGMVVKIDKEEALAPIARVTRWKYLIAGGVLVFIFLAAGYLARSIIRPLASLEAVTASIAGGDLGKRAQIQSSDEIGSLAQSFNKMADGLQESYETLEARVESRTAELQSQIAERRKVEERLSETASLQRAILDSANFTIISTDTSGIIKSFSATAELLLGYSAQELIGKTTPAIIHDKDEVVKRAAMLTEELGERVEPGFDAFVAKARRTSEPDEREWTYISKEGRRFPVRLSITPLKNERGEITGYLGVGYDISKQKEDEERLRQSEERWKFALEGSGDGVWDWNVQSSEVLFSKRWKEMLGFTEDEIGTGLDEWSKRVHPDDMTRVTADIQAYFDGKATVYVNEHRVLCKDGSWKWILDRGMLVSRTPDGQPFRMIGTHSDITERKIAEEALHRSEETLAMAQSIVNLGSWDWDIVTGALAWSDEIYRIFGLRPQEFGATYDAFVERIHPEDRENVTRAVTDAVERNIPYDIEHRIVRPDGETRYVHEQGMIMRNESGTATRMIGSVHDITARKHAEERLRLSQKVFQSAGEAIVITDADRLIVDVNPAYLSITGYSRDEVLGQNPRILKSGRHDKPFYEAMWNDIKLKGEWSGEIWDRRKSGDAYPTLLTVTVITDDYSKVTHYVGVFNDITRQKAAEEKLQQLAYYDALTKLPNRIMFRDRLRHAMETAKRSHKMIALFFMDLDRFKQVNDTLGHNIGDDLLVAVAERIGKHVRHSDTISRLGGDEFTVILEDIGSEADAAYVAVQIIGAVSEMFTIKGNEISIGASVGIGIFPADGEVDEELIKNADMAMYKAKSAGRGVFRFFRENA